jgi:hypothetical protein
MRFSHTWFVAAKFRRLWVCVLLALACEVRPLLAQSTDEPDSALRSDSPLSARDRAMKRRAGAVSALQPTETPLPAATDTVPSPPSPEAPSSSEASAFDARPELSTRGRLSGVTRKFRSGQAGADESIFGGKVVNSVNGKSAKAVVPGPGSALSDADLTITLRAASQAVYDDNITLSRTDRIASFVFAESLGITAALGDYESQELSYLALDYSPTWYIYENSPDDNSVSHQALLEGQLTGGRWKLGGKVAFLHMEGTSADIGAVEVGDRVNLNQFEASVNGRYSFTDRTLVVLSGDYLSRDYETELDSQRWRGQATLLTTLSPKIQAGLGGAAGVLDVEERGQETFQQVQLSMNYNMTGRVSLSTLLGYDFRQPEGSEDHSNLVFSVLGNYMIRDGTVFAVEGHRRIEPSAVLPGQNYMLTGFTAGVTQRFLERWTVGVKGGYDHVQYLDAGATAAVDRDYDYYFIRPSVTVSGEWWDVELFYLYRELISDDDELGFTNNQVGVRLGVIF